MALPLSTSPMLRMKSPPSTTCRTSSGWDAGSQFVRLNPAADFSSVQRLPMTSSQLISWEEVLCWLDGGFFGVAILRAAKFEARRAVCFFIVFKTGLSGSRSPALSGLLSSQA